MTALAVGAGVAVVATDLFLGIYDLQKGMNRGHTSKAYSIFETSFAGAQTIAIVTEASLAKTPQDRMGWSMLAVVPMALTLHGTLTLALVDWSKTPAESGPIDPRAVPYGVTPYAPYDPPPPPPPPSPTLDLASAPEPRVRVRFAPTMFPVDSPSGVSMAPGVAAWGVF